MADKNDHEEITEEDFKKVVQKIMLSGKPKVKAENRMPTKKELNMKWKLVKE